MKKSLMQKLRTDYSTAPAEPSIDADQPRNIGQTTLPLELIHPNPNQPRKHFSEAKHDELVFSIRERGVLQPIRVLEIRTMTEYQIIAGERRWRAAKEAGLTEIPVIIVREQPPEQALIDSLIENVHREDLNSIDRANALVELRLRLGGVSWKETLAASGLGIKQTQLFDLLGLRALPEPIQADIRDGVLTEKHGRALRTLAKDPAVQTRAWRHIKTKSLSGDDALAYTKSLKTNAPTPHTFRVTYTTDTELIAALTAKLRELRANPSS